MANWAKEAAERVGAVGEVRKVAELAPQNAIDANPAWKAHAEGTKDIKEAALTDLEWADVIVFSAPTRYGNLPAQIKQFLDTTGSLWAAGKLVNKVVTGMSSAMNPHGGQEATILSLYTTMYHWGALVVTPGYTDPILYGAGGNPYGTSATVDDKGNIREDIQQAIEVQVKRAITIARWLKEGSTNHETNIKYEYNDQLTEAK